MLVLLHVFDAQSQSSHPMVRVLDPKQKSTFKYVGTWISYIEAPLHTQFVAGVAQMGRVEIPIRSQISKSSSLVPSNYQGC